MKPKVFIGSSTERLNVAEAIKLNLDPVSEAQLWTESAFELSGTTIGSIEEQLDSADFAIMVLGADDVSVSRGTKRTVPRDNVVFELGLFMGRLGRDRVFFVIESDKEKSVKLPSDLAGVTAATYAPHSSGNLQAALGSACIMIKNAMQKRGSRLNRDFCERIKGRWWELLTTEKLHGISYVTIEPDPATGTVKMRDGRAYDLEGKHVANWSSIATCIKKDDNAVFYYWEGKNLGKPGERQGFGEIRFEESPDLFTRGTGDFSDTNLNDLQTTHMKTIELRRSTEKKEEDIMSAGDSRQISALIKKKLQTW